MQVAQSQLEHATKVCQQLVPSSNAKLLAEETAKLRQVSLPEKEEDPRKSAAAAVAAQLTASTSSAQMLSYVLSSLASEGVIGNQAKESSAEYPTEKRPKLDTDQPYIPTQNNPASLQHPEPYQIATAGQQLTSNEPPPPPSSPPPLLPPLPPMPAYSIPSTCKLLDR